MHEEDASRWPTVSVGRNVRAQDSLQSSYMLDVIARVREDQLLKREIESLRAVRALDAAAYKEQKTRLPFFCMSLFMDGIRGNKNVLSVGGCVLDFDALDDEASDALASKFKLDRRVAAFFKSPSGAGLKVIFVFSSPLDCPDQFKAFYKEFSVEFAEKHEGIRFLDSSTCDAARVCFLSWDPEVWVNENLVPLTPDHFTAREPDLVYGEDPAGEEEEALPEKPPKDPTAKVYKRMLERLKKRPMKVPRSFYVPEEVQELCVKLEGCLVEYDLRLLEMRDLQYGRKVRVKHDRGDEAEVNIYYGKNGLTVVCSSRGRIHPDLNEVLKELVISTFYGG